MKKIHEFLTEESWCKHDYAQDAAGNTVDAKDPAAVRWCFIGALNFCYDNWEEKEEALLRFEALLGNRYWVKFNDTSTWPEFHAALVKADI